MPCLRKYLWNDNGSSYKNLEHNIRLKGTVKKISTLCSRNFNESTFWLSLINLIFFVDVKNLYFKTVLNHNHNTSSIIGRIDWRQRGRVETCCCRFPKKFRIRQPRIVKVWQVSKYFHFLCFYIKLVWWVNQLSFLLLSIMIENSAFIFEAILKIFHCIETKCSFIG